MVPDIDEEVEGELQELEAHDDGDAQVQAQGASQARNQAWFLKIGLNTQMAIGVQGPSKSLFLGCVIPWVSSRNTGDTFFRVSI